MKDQSEIAGAINAIASAIIPHQSIGGNDATGGYVLSLAESIMGVTAALVKIADAIEHLAEATERKNQ
jgi:hypothetical protein